jgi:hypothetical protein
MPKGWASFPLIESALEILVIKRYLHFYSLVFQKRTLPKDVLLVFGHLHVAVGTNRGDPQSRFMEPTAWAETASHDAHQQSFLVRRKAPSMFSFVSGDIGSGHHVYHLESLHVSSHLSPCWWAYAFTPPLFSQGMSYLV